MNDNKDKRKILTYEMLKNGKYIVTYIDNLGNTYCETLNIEKFPNKDNPEKILNIKQVNDNSLMVITKTKDKVFYKDVFVKKYPGIYSPSGLEIYYAGRLTHEQFLNPECVHINDDESALAVFSIPDEDGKQTLESFYDFKEHECGIAHCLDRHYNSAFNDGIVNMEYVFKKNNEEV